MLLPPSVDEWLPERNLARFVVEVIGRLDLSAMGNAYRGSGSASYHPGMLLGLLVYGYATGVFSSRQLERATCNSVAFRVVAANDHPDHDTIATFRRRFLAQIGELFVQVLMLARESGVLQLGTVALDGTKVHANASRHSALSWEHANRIEAREAKAKRTGTKPGGKPPAAPVGGPGPKDQVNLSDEDSRIMPVAGGGFGQTRNAQAAVAGGSLLVVTADVVQAANDKQQVAPTLDALDRLPESIESAGTMTSETCKAFASFQQTESDRLLEWPGRDQA